MKKVFSFLLLLSVCACVSNVKEEADEVKEYSKNFKADYDTVFRATQQALLNYPMNINNQDTGTLQTLFITGRQRFKAPHVRTKLLNGFQYRLNVRILGSDSDRKTKVAITKEVRIKTDFFSDPKELVSDGYEEKAVFYRIAREIKIERLLKKAHEEMEDDE